MCAGRVDFNLIFRAFSSGADGVFIAACRLNECNYATQGNYGALNKVVLSRRLLEHAGLSPERVHIEFMSAGEGILFAETVNAFAARIRRLGSLGAGEGVAGDELRARLGAITRLIPYIKRVKKEKLAQRLSGAGDYERLYTREEVEVLFREAVSYHIDPNRCQACMICARRCPAGAIAGGRNQIHVIGQDKCMRCGVCLEVCPSRFGAVEEVVGKPLPRDE